MSYGRSFWSPVGPKSIGSSSIKWEASEISSNRKSRCLCSFSEKEGSSHQGSSDAACVPSHEYRNSLRRVAAKLASIFFLQSDIIHSQMRNPIAFMVRAHRLPIRLMTDLVNFDFVLSSSLTALARTHRLKNNLVASPGNAADDVYFPNRLRVMISAQISLGQGRWQKPAQPL